MANETDGEKGKAVIEVIEGQQIERAFVAADGSITVPHSEARLKSVDVADIDLLLTFSDGTFVIIPNGALDATADPFQPVVFTDGNDSSFNPTDPGSDNKSTLGDLFKMVGIINHAKAGSLRVVSGNVDAPKTLEEVEEPKTEGNEPVTPNDLPPLPAPIIKTGSGIALTGRGSAPGASGFSDQVYDSPDPVAPVITPRPSVYRAGNKTINIIDPAPTITLDANITADDIINIAEAGGSVAITGRAGGDAKGGDTVTLTVNGVAYNGLVQTGGAFSIDVAGSELVNDLDTTIRATITITDTAGNTGTATDTEDYTVDITVPTAPGVALATDSGANGSDLLTNDGTLALSGIESGASVEYSVDGNTWSTGFTAVEGANSVQVRQTDMAGNTGSVGSLSFTLDTAAAAPGVTLATDSGMSGSDLITKVGTLVLTGIESGASVEYSSDGGVTWSSSFTAVEGTNSVQVRQTDVAGNTNVSSFAFTLDTVSAAPVVALANDSGTSNSDLITNVGTLTLTGIEPGAVVEYSTDGGATWSAGFTAVEGVNSVQVRQTDVAGNTSNVGSHSFTLDTSAAAPGVALAIDSGASGSDLVTNIGTLALTGIESGATVEYSVDGGATWNSSFTAAEGANSVQVRQIDLAGNTSSVGSLDRKSTRLNSSHRL